MSKVYRAKSAIKNWTISLINPIKLLNVNAEGMPHIILRHFEDYVGENIIEKIVDTLIQTNKLVDGEELEIEACKVGIRDGKIVIHTIEDKIQRELKGKDEMEQLILLEKALKGELKKDKIKSTLVLGASGSVITFYSGINKSGNFEDITNQLEQNKKVVKDIRNMQNIPSYFQVYNVLWINPLNPALTADMLEILKNKENVAAVVIPFLDICNQIKVNKQKASEVVDFLSLISFLLDDKDRKDIDNTKKELSNKRYEDNQIQLSRGIFGQLQDFIEKRYGVDVVFFNETSLASIPELYDVAKDYLVKQPEELYGISNNNEEKEVLYAL